MPKIDQNHRIQKLEKLIDELSLALEQQQHNKDSINLYVPSHDSLQNRSDDELNKLEQRMMEALTQLKPSSFSHPLASQPIPPHRPPAHEERVFRTAVNAELGGRLWELDAISQENQKKKWQNNMLSSLNH